MGAVGQPKTGGRKKGTPNKRATIDANAIAERMNVNPFEILLSIAAGDWESLGYPSATTTRYSQSGEPYTVDVIELGDRLSAAKDACTYLMPKRKALEVNIKSEIEEQAEAFEQFSDEKKAELLEAEAKRLRGMVE